MRDTKASVDPARLRHARAIACRRRRLGRTGAVGRPRLVQGLMVATTVTLFLGMHAPAQAQSTISLARIGRIPDQTAGGEILQAIYGRLGISVELVDVPAARALVLSNAGLLDGEVQRIQGISRDHPSLIQISPAINYIEPTAFSAKLRFDVRGWESIARYRVGIVRGVGSSEAGTKDMADVTRASDLEGLIRLLRAGRIDVLVTDLFSAELTIRKMRLDRCIHALLPPMERIFVYHYLHQRHATLAMRVATTIRDMEATGELAQARATAVNRLLDETKVTAASSGRDPCAD